MVKARNLAALLLPLLTSCGDPVDPDDVSFFRDGSTYLPAGFLCGLAYYGGYGQHMGGSCMGVYDPALDVRTTENILVAPGRTEAASCPDGFRFSLFNDRDSPDPAYFGASRYATCASEGNELSSSADPRDLPAGAVCGIAGMRSLDDDHFSIPCEGRDPALEDCPEGYELRWVPDAFKDGTGEDCLPDGSDATDSGAIALFFCAVKDSVGCTSEACLDTETYEGMLCGLHARGSGSSYFLQDEVNWEYPASTSFDVNLYQTYYDSWFLPCSAYDAALAGRLEELRAGIAPPMCMGVDVSSQGCPAPLELVCAPGWWGQTSEAYVSYTAMCWCSTEGAQQRLAEQDRALDTGEP